ncbi:OprD family outer membrane porin [Emticicia sp.]|uniref:OprD family outer membrane porin n=1 Tax=Emticicia sp. TaxID=1930953 RepID=UPI0037535D86
MRRINFYYVVWSFFIYINFTNAQGIHAHHEVEKDTNTINHFFEKGRFYGHARSYMSATLNKGDLTDYNAWGIGAGIGYETPKILKHFQVGISGFFMFNLKSSDLSNLDPKTNQTNRYEIGLFDIERPNDHEDLDRLEELFFKIHAGKKSILTIGRQIPQTPFINPQDGRMRPTLIEAAALDVKEWKNISLHGEYIWRISPRSTVRWFDTGESIGIYPVGVDVNGKPSQYKNNIESAGVGVIGSTYQKKQLNIQLWDTYIDNVLNTAQLKIEWKSKSIAGKNWFVGGQYIQQNSIGNGGNEDPTKAYTQINSGAKVFSGRVGQQSAKFDWFLNATRTTAQGRYLMPREWGREPFYTFMPRERNEGFGDVTVATINTFYKPENHIKIELSGGYFQLPDVKNFALNKYGMPSYSQINLGLTYQFDNYLKGLNALLLVVRKDDIGETYQNDRYVFNKVNMTHLNIIINYHY